MSNAPNIHEQFRHQREMARLQRRHHGADQTLDRAEMRHEAIWGWVLRARYLVPIALAPVLGCIFPHESLAGIVLGAPLILGAIVVSRLFAVLVDRIAGKFAPDIFYPTETLGFVVTGAIVSLIGWTLLYSSDLPYAWEPLWSIMLSGLVLAATPFVWRRWATAIMQGTSFTELKRDAETPQVHRIIE